jgi:hypothetical protein
MLRNSGLITGRERLKKLLGNPCFCATIFTTKTITNSPGIKPEAL